MKIIYFVIFFSISLLSDDIYIFSFSKDSNCTLKKNSKQIDLFDKRFKNSAPQSPYTCQAIQKEQYNNCIVLSKKNISAFYYGYGSYSYTNLIMAFQNIDSSHDSSVKIKCTKQLDFNDTKNSKSK